MKTTKKQLQEIKEVEKKVAEVCGTEKSKVIFDKITGIPYAEREIQPKQTVKVSKSDDGTIVNKETGKPHFSKEKKSRIIEIALAFGDSAPSLKYQLKEQGFKFPNGFIKDAELIRTHLLSLRDIRILNEKQLIKCLKRLHKRIGQMAVNSIIKENETAKHIKTKTSN